MITIEFLHDFIFENCQKVSVSKGGHHFHTRCPLCGDSKKSLSKKRFHVEFNNAQPFFHCFNCGESGSFLELYSKIKCVSISEAKKILYRFDPNYLIQALSPRKKEKIVEEIEYESHDYILDDCIGINTDVSGIIESQYKQELQNFITKRKIPPDVPIFIAYKGDYKNRIIIPIYEDGCIVYFQGRALEDTNYDQKYKNPTLQKGSIILNKEKFDRSKYIIVSEGLIDAFMVGTQGTSCLGAYVNAYFIESLLKLTDKGVILALDNDETGTDEIRRILGWNKKLHRFDNLKEEKWAHKVKYFIMPDKNIKDLGELTLNSNIGDVYLFVVNNSYDQFNVKVLLDSGG